MPSKAQLKLWSRLPRRDNESLPVDELQDLGLPQRHAPGVDLVIVAQQMERTVSKEDGQLKGGRETVGAGLAQHLARADHDVAEKARRAGRLRPSGLRGRARRPLPRLLERERQYVGDLILVAMFGVQRADAAFADKLDGQLGATHALRLEHPGDKPGDRFIVQGHAGTVEDLDEVHASPSLRR